MTVAQAQAVKPVISPAEEPFHTTAAALLWDGRCDRWCAGGIRAANQRVRTPAAPPERVLRR
jgi:hypothetical protein